MLHQLESLMPHSPIPKRQGITFLDSNMCLLVPKGTPHYDDRGKQVQLRHLTGALYPHPPGYRSIPFTTHANAWGAELDSDGKIDTPVMIAWLRNLHGVTKKPRIDGSRPLGSHIGVILSEAIPAWDLRDNSCTTFPRTDLVNLATLRSRKLATDNHFPDYGASEYIISLAELVKLRKSQNPQQVRDYVSDALKKAGINGDEGDLATTITLQILQPQTYDEIQQIEHLFNGLEPDTLVPELRSGEIALSKAS